VVSVAPERIRLAEVLAALSLTSDLGSGMAFEKGLRTCVVACAFAEALDLDRDEQRTIFEAALLRGLGCTAYSSETAATLGDDRAFQRALKTFDRGKPEQFVADYGARPGSRQAELLTRVADRLPVTGVHGARAGCEVSASLGSRLGLSHDAIVALDEVYERWDGTGLPEGRAGEQLTLAARVLHVAEQAVMADADDGAAGAIEAVRSRAGGHLDPALCDAFERSAEEILAPLAGPDMLAAVIAAEPAPVARVSAADLDALCLALAIYTDLKGMELLGHSPHVARLASGAGALAGLDEEAVRQLRLAALLHDLGRTAVSSEIWDRPDPLGAADLERVRLHSYWTERILGRCPGLSHLAPVAAAHHERLDGSGYHRGASAADQPLPARILAAADVFAAITEARAHRPALSYEQAAEMILAEAAGGRLDGVAVVAVVEAAGLPRPRMSWPLEQTDPEVQVLRLCARGLTNQEIAEQLVVSARTVQHHLAHIYDKTGRRTRAGVAVLAVEHGLAEVEQAKSG
jgi:HD-GYP domain-containing protein (c-di-GMP phosphodiesterase class II)/DNA-binding CsgD family transcriptional regulator